MVNTQYMPALECGDFQTVKSLPSISVFAQRHAVLAVELTAHPAFCESDLGPVDRRESIPDH